MPERKFSVKLDVNNIGPHNGINKINFSDEVDSNKAIFYAYNGTGKSFISRAFRLTSAEKFNTNVDDLLTLGQASGTLSFKIVNAGVEKKLSVSVQRGTPVVIKNDTGYIFHVFNSDFVEENIKPRNYTPDGNIEGYILGKVQIDLSSEKEREKQLQNAIKEKDKKITDAIEAAKEELREKGVHTSTNEFALIDKSRLRQNEALGDVQLFDEIVRQLDSLKQLPEKLPDINEPSLSVSDTIFEDIATLLTTAYPKTEWDEEFVAEIKSKRAFIEKGLEIIANNESVCPFCKQSMKSSALELIRRYKAFLANKEAEILRKIESNILAINGIIERIKQYAQATKSSNADIVSLKKYFPSLEKTELAIPDIDESTFICFNSVITYLNRKNDDISYTDISINTVISECRDVIKALLRQQKSNSTIIKGVNKTKQDSNGERLALRRNLCKAQYLRCKSSLSPSFAETEQLQAELDALQQSIVEKEQQARVSKKDRVYETLKFFLNRFFAGKYTIDKDTFQIKFLGSSIGQKASKILSDGEKSIVAFCYYLASTHLQLIREDDYNNLFFIIDDPISSMDFHYVYAVAQSLRDIKEFFGITTHDRMWVFTHNMEFFSIAVRNSIITQSYIMRPGAIEHMKSQLLMPYENHLNDIIEIAYGKKTPTHTTGNSIRHVLETVCRFEYPDKKLEKYISENQILADNSCIFSLCQDLSHGAIRNQPPFSSDVLTAACQVVIKFMNSRYRGQIEAIKL